MRTPLLFLALTALAACATHETERESSAARGLAFAQQNCAACHALGAGELQSPNAAAPPFAELANTPGMGARALNAWLHTSHPTMVNLIVEPAQSDDIWAYMETLREPPRRN